ncbi:MAG: TolC family protein, partial [Chromatiales bacterium]|nr:TolC family protein [Chromatiales bacterium]
MSTHFRSLALLAALLPAAATAGPLSLEDAIRQALSQNPELRASGARAEAAGARADSAWGNLLPQVNLRYMARRSDNPLDAFADKLNTRSVQDSDFESQAINYPGASNVRATTRGAGVLCPSYQVNLANKITERST